MKGLLNYKKIIALFVCLALNEITNAAPLLEAYGHLPDVELIRLSPSGERYTFVAVIGESRRLIVTSDKWKTLFSAGIGGAKVRDIRWVGENRVLVWMSTTFEKDIGLSRAHEFYSVINIDLKKNAASPVWGGAKTVSDLVFGYAGSAHVDNHEYGYFVGLTYAKVGEDRYEMRTDHRDLYRVDLESNEVTFFANGGGGPSFSWVVGGNGEVVAHSEYNWSNKVWHLYAGVDNEKLLFEKTAPFEAIKLIGLGRASNVVVVSDNSSGIRITEEISVLDGKREIIFPGLWVENYLTNPDNGVIIGATTLEEPRAVYFDRQLQARVAATRKAFPNFQMEVISSSRNLDRLIVKTDGADDSGTYWRVDIATGQADPIGHPYPEIKAADVAPTQWFEYKASDGLDIRAVLTLPIGRKSELLPLVVLPHGGPFGVLDVLGFEWWAQAFASKGYAVLQPNFRGSGGNGEEFLKAGYNQLGYKMQTDISDGVVALSSAGLIDAKRVCIVGASYGGYAALYGVTLQRDIYRCAVSVGGVSDLLTMRLYDRGYDGFPLYWRTLPGMGAEVVNSLKSTSPIYFADQASAPILLIHGKDDTVVPIEQSRKMESALRSANKPVEFIEMQGEDHWLSREETRKTMLKASVAFVQKYNPPD